MPGRRVMPANTSAASAICGTHFGLTNADTSMTGRFAALNRFTNAILSAVETRDRSFCRPSRGPTSTTVMCFPAQVVIANCHENTKTRNRPFSLELDEQRVCVDEPAFAAVHRRDDPVARRADGQLHFHR